MEKALVLLGLADGDADPGLKWRAHGAHDHPFAEQVFVDRPARLLNVDQDEIALARRDAEARCLQGFGELAAVTDRGFHARAQMGLVAESGLGGDLAQRADVERSAKTVEIEDELRGTKDVADAERSKPIGFRKGSKNRQPLARIAKLGCRGEILGIGVLDIGFVDDRENALGQQTQEPLELGLCDVAAGRVVRVRDEEKLGLGGYGVEQIVDVPMQVVAKRDGGEGELLGDGTDSVAGKRRMTEDRVIAAARKDAADQVDELVRAVPETELLRRYAVMDRKRLAELVASRVGVTLESEVDGAQGLDGLRRRTIRVLVRGELHDVADAELAPELVFGFAGLVRRQREDVGCREVAHGDRSAQTGIASDDLGITGDAAQLLDRGQDRAVGDVTVHLEEEHVSPLGSGRGAGLDTGEVDLAVRQWLERAVECAGLVTGRHGQKGAVLARARWEPIADDAEARDHVGVVFESVLDELEAMELFEQRGAERCGLVVAAGKERCGLAGLHVDQNRIRVARAQLPFAGSDGWRRAVDLDHLSRVAGLREQLVAKRRDALRAELGVGVHEALERGGDRSVGRRFERDHAERRMAVQHRFENGQ